MGKLIDQWVYWMIDTKQLEMEWFLIVELVRKDQMIICPEG